MRCTIARNDDGSSKGFGFVTFVSAEVARNAISGMHGFAAAEGKFLSVSPKKGLEHLVPPRINYPPAGRLDAPLSGMEPPPGATVFVFQVPQNWHEADLQRHFIHFGTIVSLVLMRKG